MQIVLALCVCVLFCIWTIFDQERIIKRLQADCKPKQEQVTK